MYFISWKTIPQALSTVRKKPFLKSLDRCTVNIHHNHSSHLPAMSHRFFSLPGFALSLAFHFFPLSPNLIFTGSSGKVRQSSLWGDPSSKGAEVSLSIFSPIRTSLPPAARPPGICSGWEGFVALRTHSHPSPEAWNIAGGIAHTREMIPLTIPESGRHPQPR